MGAEVADPLVPGWRLNENNMEASCELLQENSEEDCEGETIVLYQLFDNTSFFAIGTDGTDSLPTCSLEDRKRHHDRQGHLQEGLQQGCPSAESLGTA
jgi:hypothetical protein